MVRILHTVVHICLGLSTALPETLRRRSPVGIKLGNFLSMSLAIVQHCSMVFSLNNTGGIFVSRCLLFAVRLLQQRSVSVSQLQSAHLLVLEFTEEYEAIYYHSMVSCLHFC